MTKQLENAVENTKCGHVIPTAYDLGLEDLQELFEFCTSGSNNAVVAAIITAFRYGFVMGNRATLSRNLKRL